MEDNSSGEDITDRITLRSHISNIDDFRCNKAGSSTSHKQIFLLIRIGRQSKIADSKIPSIFLAEHDVFRLQVAVDDAVAGEMGKSSQDILQYCSGLLGIELAATLDESMCTFKRSLSCDPSRYSKMT